VESPTNLQFFEVSDKKIVLTWNSPAADVSGYRVTPDAPTDIHFMNVTENSAVILWYAPRAKITGYRLFLTVEGSTPKQLKLPARLTQYTLLNLKPDTEYTATLHSEIDNTLSEGESKNNLLNTLHLKICNKIWSVKNILPGISIYSSVSSH
uniref:Fibronectin type-III domain-containing protein n=1 Tax=Periophthalmus magnuspinnatus TaxID=409849 RepID=A0A3B4BHH5_9GOBI